MKTEIIDKLTTLSTVTFGLVAALAWNSAIQSLFAQLFPGQSDLAALFGYAILVTLIAVVITVYLGKAADKAKTIQLKLPIKSRKL